MSFLDSSIVKLNVNLKTPDDAIEMSGRLLEKAGYVTENYINNMLNSYKENGPYFVISPNIAIAHARPEDGVLKSSISLVQLEEPVEFGHKCNDPVKLVFGLAATTDEEHLETIKKLITLLSDKNNIDLLMSSKNFSEIQKVIDEVD